MMVEEYNNLSAEAQYEILFQCCSSHRWVNALIITIPFSSLNELKTKADSCWINCTIDDYKEAFSHHPKIGDINTLKEKFDASLKFAQAEQRQVSGADETVLNKLITGNELYETKFGYIFIICATGKSATEILIKLESRLQNNPEDEIIIAAAEQQKIMQLRIDKIFL